MHEEQRNKLEQMAFLEKHSVSNLIEVMADERWERLVEQQGVVYAKTVAEAMYLKLEMDNPAHREKLRRAVLALVGEKNAKAKRACLKFSHPLFWLALCNAIHVPRNFQACSCVSITLPASS